LPKAAQGCQAQSLLRYDLQAKRIAFGATQQCDSEVISGSEKRAVNQAGRCTNKACRRQERLDDCLGGDASAFTAAHLHHS
jgi:hypothetical protein